MYENKGIMSDLEAQKQAEFINQLLAERDRLYQEASRLRDRLSDKTDVASLKADYEKKLSVKDEIILLQQAKIEALMRRIWGKSSEKFIHPDPLQRKIDFDGEDLLAEEKEAAEEAQKETDQYREKTIKVKVREKQTPVRQPLPEDLPRVEKHLYPEEATADKEVWTELAPEVTEVLEYKPGTFYVKRFIRHKYVLKDKSKEVVTPIVTASMPLLPIAKSYAGASLLTELMVNKYVNHLPFYRQIGIFKQQGLKIPQPTINDWFKETADLLRPLYFRLKELTLGSDYLQVDETTIPIVRNEKQKTIKGYIWMVRAVMEDLVFFHYDYGSRAQKVIIPLLKDFQGALQTDAYAVYDIYENKKGVLPLGCWAHARRKFFEAEKEDKARAEYALEQIGLLYDIEKRADEENLSYEERSDLRTRLSYPLMVRFEKWLLMEADKTLPKSRIGKAIRYTYNIYHKLTRYHLDGRYRIDNNLAENALRGIALGRENYLFCQTDQAAEDAAVFYSLLGCCKAKEVNFKKWMNYVLTHIHEYDNDYSKDLAELLPHNVKETIKDYNQHSNVL